MDYTKVKNEKQSKIRLNVDSRGESRVGISFHKSTQFMEIHKVAVTIEDKDKFSQVIIGIVDLEELQLKIARMLLQIKEEIKIV